MEDFLNEYGYLALTLATFLEGETAILIAASLVSSGVFNGPETVFFGFFGSFLSDWMYFLIGRINGTFFVERRPALKAKLDPARKFFESHRLQILVSYRFLYGLRTVLPLMIGLTGVRPLYFLGFSIVAGLCWSSLVGSAGYLAGKYFQLTASSFESNGFLIVFAFATLGILLGLTVKKVAEQQMSIPAGKKGDYS